MDERHILGLNLHPKMNEMKVLVDISKLVQDCTYAKLVRVPDMIFLSRIQ